MQQSSDKKITFLVGNEKILEHMRSVSARQPFYEGTIEFLNDLSKKLMGRKASRRYPDVVTLGFWLRKASVLQLKKRFYHEENVLQFGRGVVFHIAPSNVPVNFAYSLIAGLLSGNANIVRVPSKNFEQIEMITNAIMETLEVHKEMEEYICLVRYDRDRAINDRLSAICDTRIIWGGDGTIEELRKSPLPPSSTEITFADRYSLAVLDSDQYLELENKDRIAEEFYNDTYLSDQNACTSPRIVIWTGSKKEEAKQIFWSFLHDLVEKRYDFMPIQAVNKLTSAYLVSAVRDGVKIRSAEDNLIVRVQV
ncbi:MAG: hypothetical protein IJ733_18375, partial [Lachnospiraceae bacterium]|nr:hypothetical protein [Lachnospiraceae bacterium]